MLLRPPRIWFRGALGVLGITGFLACADTSPSDDSTTDPTPAVPQPQPPMTGMGMMPTIDLARIPSADSGFSTFRVRPASDRPTRHDGMTGQFRMTYDFSHMNFDDPIVYPGVRNATHLHVFFGNTKVDAMSTTASIQSTGNSSCSGGIANRSAYWVPAIIDTRTGTPQKPSDILVYYKSDPLVGRTVQAFPPGLRMIAGDARSSSPVPHTDWGCLTSSTESRFAHIPATCAAGNTIEMTIGFPSCWDGRNLDSPDHKSHMAYPVSDRTSPTGSACPASHPVPLPTLTEKVRYRVAASGATAFWRLSSDNYPTSQPGGYSVHADWWGGWEPTIERTWVQRCLNDAMDCHGFLLGDGREIF